MASLGFVFETATSLTPSGKSDLIFSRFFAISIQTNFHSKIEIMAVIKDDLPTISSDSKLSLKKI
jgi:hypothetical protein